MSVRVMTWVWQHSPAKHAERLVLLAIADNASDDGTRAWPSIGEIMRKSGLSERAVQGAIRGMAGKSWLTVDAQAGPHGCNRYAVIMTPAESAPPQNLHPRRICPDPPQILRDPPAESAPEPSLEPSKNHPTTPTVLPPATRKRGARLPDDWQPTAELVAWARTETPDVDGRTETEKFRNHWHSTTGRGATKLRWDLAWRNWMLNARDRYGGRQTTRDLQRAAAEALDVTYLDDLEGVP